MVHCTPVLMLFVVHGTSVPVRVSIVILLDRWQPARILRGVPLDIPPSPGGLLEEFSMVLVTDAFWVAWSSSTDAIVHFYTARPLAALNDIEGGST